MPDPLTALATNIQSARLPQTLHLRSHSQEECLYQPALTPEDWLAAYGATVAPNFTEQILGALLDPPVLAEFASEIVEPLANRNDTTQVFNYLHRTLSAQQVDWTILVPAHRTVVDPTPPEDDLVRVLPREDFPPSGGWIDNIAQKIDYLVSLLTQADDLPRSRNGWIHISALKQAQRCLATKTLTLTLSFITAPLLSAAAARPSPSMALLYTTWSPSTTDVANFASPRFPQQPTRNCPIFCIAPSASGPLVSHLNDALPHLPRLRLLYLIFPPLVYIFAVNPP